MRKDDYTFCTYRGHNHTYVRGVTMTSILGELMGRECGLLRGKGGSMHLTSVEHGAMGSYAIIGAHLPVAAGAAWSAQYKGTGQVSVCFFGDGTTNIGAFHEALNFAVIWELPVVFVCENNLYMEYTPIAEVTPVKHPAADRAPAYGMDVHRRRRQRRRRGLPRGRQRGHRAGPHRRRWSVSLIEAQDLSPGRPQPRRSGPVPPRHRGIAGMVGAGIPSRCTGPAVSWISGWARTDLAKRSSRGPSRPRSIGPPRRPRAHRNSLAAAGGSRPRSTCGPTEAPSWRN